MKTVAGEIQNFNGEQISTLEKEGKIEVSGYEITSEDVEISPKISQDGQLQAKEKPQ
jgi:isoleucyl-tRNA synthetase